MKKTMKLIGAALIAVAAFSLAACSTTMAESDGPAPAALQGSWTLVSWSDSAPLPDQPITLQIEDARVSGNSACNNYSGPLTSDDSAFHVGLLATTMMLCADDVNTAETTYQGLLTGANSWKISDGLLSLSKDGIEQLQFQAAN